MPGPIRDPRAALRACYAERFSAPELPVPVEAIAEDLLGLNVAEDDDLWFSGLLLPAEREIWLNGREARAAQLRATKPGTTTCPRDERRRGLAPA